MNGGNRNERREVDEERCQSWWQPTDDRNQQKQRPNDDRMGQIAAKIAATKNGGAEMARVAKQPRRSNIDVRKTAGITKMTEQQSGAEEWQAAGQTTKETVGRAGKRLEWRWSDGNQTTIDRDEYIRNKK